MTPVFQRSMTKDKGGRGDRGNPLVTEFSSLGLSILFLKNPLMGQESMIKLSYQGGLGFC